MRSAASIFLTADIAPSFFRASRIPAFVLAKITIFQTADIALSLFDAGSIAAFMGMRVGGEAYFAKLTPETLNHAGIDSRNSDR